MRLSDSSYYSQQPKSFKCFSPESHFLFLKRKSTSFKDLNTFTPEMYYAFSNVFSIPQSWYMKQNTTSSWWHTEFLPFQSLTQPSSPEEASTVPVMFQLTRHTWELWLSNCATIWISNFVNPPDEVNSFLLKRRGTVLHTTVQRSGFNMATKREDCLLQ